MLNQRLLLSRVALRTIRFTLSDIQCGADKNWQTKTTWWSTLDCLKVILRIIRITLSERITSSRDCVLCNKNNWMISQGSVLMSVYSIVYIAMRSTRSKAASIACHIEPYQIHSQCHSIKEQWLIFINLMSRLKREKIKISRPINNDCLSSWGFSSYVCSCDDDAWLFNNLMEPRGESINIMRIFIVQITPRSTDSPIKSSPTPHDPIPLI